MFTALRKSEKGAVLVYVAVGLTALLAVVGLSFDLGRHYILQQELQKAADAAATAGAYQIDTGSTVAETTNRIWSAATGSAAPSPGEPITANANKIGAANETGIIDIADVTILSTIPDDDDTPIPTTDSFPARYVAVTTQARINNNVFARLAGADPTVSLTATAVARRGQAICQITPLFMCNPAEAVSGSGASFELEDWLGKQFIAKDGKSTGPNSQWLPGNFGYLGANTGPGAKSLAQALADQDGLDACFDSRVETEPGGTEGARNGLNTRFDIYEQPFPGGFDLATQGPAESVRKGYSGADCAMSPDTEANGFFGLPRDTAFPTLSASYPDARIGNGIWNCELYWDINFGLPVPADLSDCTTTTDASTLSRFDVYRYEIDAGASLLNNQSQIAGGGGGGGEVGTPQCNAANTVSPPGDDLSRDRRIITMAVVNCLEHADAISGGKTELPVEAFVNGFLTEPTTVETNQALIIMEILGTDNPGEDSIAEVVSRDWVEVVR